MTRTGYRRRRSSRAPAFVAPTAIDHLHQPPSGSAMPAHQPARATRHATRRGIVTIVRGLASVTLALALTACMSLGDATPTTIYAPTVQMQSNPSWPSVQWQLALASPSASQFLDTRRIVVQPAANRLQVYKGALWTDNATVLVQTALLRAFDDSGKITATARFGDGLRGDYALLLDLRHFEAIYHGATPDITIEINAKLTRLRGSGVVAARTFRQVVPSTGTDIDAVVAAFGSGLSALAHELAGWTLVEGERAQRADAATPDAGMGTAPVQPAGD